MKENKREHGHDKNKAGRESSNIGNQQNTTQTGAQNSGGKNRDQKEDPFADDLRKSKEHNRSGS